LCLNVAPSRAAVEPWGANGNVLAIASSGNTIYLGGVFTRVGPATGGGAIVSAASGAPIDSIPRIAGTVNAVVSDGVGGWFVGGAFVGVAGRPCNNLAHLRSDGMFTEWNPSIDGPVFALARNADTLYVGGDFPSVGGQSRSKAAAFDTRTGLLTGWDPQANGFVRTLAVYRGCVFAGGWFGQIGGQNRSHLAKLTGDTGLATTWIADANSEVASFAVSNDTLYVGGYFDVLAGVHRNFLAAVNAETGALLDFDPEGVREPLSDFDALYSGVSALAIAGPSLFVGGHFVGMGGQSRIGMAEVNRVSGIATDWAPLLGPIYDGWPTPSVRALVIGGGSLYVAGDFSTVDSLDRGSVARFGLPGGALTAWDPRADAGVFALAAEEDRIFLGGGFTSLWSWESRNGLAALDATTGQLLPWNPVSDAWTINSLAAGSGKVYVSGLFSTMGGQPRNCMAALDSATGLATAWDPNPNSIALSMALADGSLYAGGYFTGFSGSAHSYAAKLDTVTGVAAAWDPHCDDWVESIAVADGDVYLGGWFHQAGGQVRNHLAEVDATAGLASAWAPDPDGPLCAVVVADTTVVIGGSFGHAGGAAHASVAALSKATGTALAWNMDIAGGDVNTLASSGNCIYVGGGFSSICGQPRAGLAAIDGATGTVLPWQSNLGPSGNGVVGTAWSSLARDGGLWLGGSFTIAGVLPAASVAWLDGPAPQVAGHRLPIMLARSMPNPASEVATIRYVLSTPASVSLTIFDLQGRRMASPLARVLEAAGPHSVSVNTQNWPPGCYLYRVQAGGASAMRKMVVVR
jgi:pyrimidine deaminase RibD-like protein